MDSEERRRRFNSRERVALYLLADGRCERCGCELQEGWHADHETPFVKGGATDVANGRALCPRCNLSKGSTMKHKAFDWQDAARELFIGTAPSNFLIEATPGAGKTRLGAEIVGHLLKSRQCGYATIVVPSKRLRKQSALAYRQWTGALNIHYEWKPGAYPKFPDAEFHGVAVTYQTVAQWPELFRAQCSRVPTVVVLDEIHHASDDKSWGCALRTAFDVAQHRVLLSGTPFRSDERAIPYVRYDSSRTARPDVRYGYGEALDDGVVRPVYFPKIDGQVEWVDEDGYHLSSFDDDDVDERGESKRLRTFLMKDGDAIIEMVRRANGWLSQIRVTDPDAAGLVVAINQDHAQYIAERMRRELRVDVALAISKEDDAPEVIESFVVGKTTWIVAVKLVSEGVDIPRLRACVYASNVVTELFFRQVVGRVVRREPDTPPRWAAKVYIPKDKRLVRFALNIKKERVAVLGEEKEEGPGIGATGGGVPSAFTMLSAEGREAGTIAAGMDWPQAHIDQAREIKARHTETRHLDDEEVALILHEATLGRTPSRQQPEQTHDETASIRRMKDANNKIARRIAESRRIPHENVNRSLNRAVGIPSITSCDDEPTLRRRAAIGRQWLLDGREPANGW